jgi:hypothetical protein
MEIIFKLAYLVDILGTLNNSSESVQRHQINELIQNDETKALIKNNCGKQTWDVTFLTYFLLSNIAPVMLQKLTRTFHQPLGCFAETLHIVL